MRIVEGIAELARRKDATPAQVALAWVLSRGDDIVAIPGTKRRQYLEDNAAAAELELSDAEMRRLDEVALPGMTMGDRYPDMSTVEV